VHRAGASEVHPPDLLPIRPRHAGLEAPVAAQGPDQDRAPGREERRERPGGAQPAGLALLIEHHHPADPGIVVHHPEDQEPIQLETVHHPRRLDALPQRATQVEAPLGPLPVPEEVDAVDRGQDEPLAEGDRLVDRLLLRVGPPDPLAGGIKHVEAVAAGRHRAPVRGSDHPQAARAQLGPPALTARPVDRLDAVVGVDEEEVAASGEAPRADVIAVDPPSLPTIFSRDHAPPPSSSYRAGKPLGAGL
jgi:hypothetical protein